MVVNARRIDCVFVRKSTQAQDEQGQIANVQNMLRELGVSVPESQWFVGTVSRRKVRKNADFARLMDLIEADRVGTVYIESQDRWGSADRKELFHLLYILEQHRTRLFDLRALATRIPTIHLNVSRDEILALMKELCQKDYVSDQGTLPAAVCDEVLAYFLTVYPQDRIFDIRILIRALDDRLGVQALGKKLSSSWKELILAQLTGTVEPPLTRREETCREHGIALELAKSKLSKQERLHEWKKRTGKSRDTYYRLLRKLQ